MKFDLSIIGGGPGGYYAAIRASQFGKKVCLIDKDNLGGICLNWGCIPTKTLLKNAEVYNYIKNSRKYGINVERISLDTIKNITTATGNLVIEGLVNLLLKTFHELILK